MPKRIPVQTIILHREGKRVVPEIGKSFNFTVDELADINAVNPKAIRHIINEESQVDAAAADQTEGEGEGEGAKKTGEAKPKKPAKTSGTDDL